MLTLALEYLGEEDPFFIMCEGGEIDWAAHENKTMAMVHEVLDLDRAVQVAVEFYEKHPDETLIVVTADHETGGAVLGQGPKWIPENFRWDLLEQQWIESNGQSVLSKEENKALNDRCQIGWTTANHSGSPVPIYAIGKGAERFCGRMDNTDIRGKILGE
jgi:alkaline phosphatase